MGKRRLFGKHGAWAVAAADVAALAVFYRIMPTLRRPFELLMALLTVLAVLTMLAVKRDAVRTLALVAASICGTLFSLEMAQKFFNILSVAEARDVSGVMGGGAYGWRAEEPDSYFAARERARRDGLLPEAAGAGFPDGFFTEEERSRLVSHSERIGRTSLFYEGTRPAFRVGPPLGYEWTPDNRFRHRMSPVDGDKALWDARNTIDARGARVTPGAGGTDAVFLFLGCSFTYGHGLNDDETLPHYFSEAYGFAVNAVNLGVSGHGPAHALRELELSRRTDWLRPRAAAVRGVFFGLIDDHAVRVIRPRYDGVPRYRLDGDRAVFQSLVLKEDSRLAVMMERSRLYPAIRDRLYNLLHGDVFEYKWRLTIAILAEMDRLCRERFGVGLTVVYWGDDSRVAERIAERGMDLIPAGDAFPEKGEWRAESAIRYLLYDGHPSAHANRLLALRLKAWVDARDPDAPGPPVEDKNPVAVE